MANNQIAYGFMGLTEMFAERVTAVNMGLVTRAIEESQTEYNRQLSAIMATLASRVTLAQEKVEIPGSGTLQPLDEYGNPKPVPPLGNYTCGYPIQGGGTAWGTNRVTQALLTVGEANRATVDAQGKDLDWMRRHSLAAMLAAANWTFADAEAGNLTVVPLANGDTVTYPRVGGGVPAVDTHQLAQAAAISDTDPFFPTLYSELAEHPSNSGPYAAYIPTNLVSSVMGLTSFVTAPEIAIQPAVTQDQIVGNLAEVQRMGSRVLGYVKGYGYAIEWPALPDNYGIGIALGAEAPLAQREYAAAELQGLFSESHSPDGNRLENRFIRYCGFGGRNRVAAAVFRIGNGTYAVPTGFTPPLSA